MGGNSLSMWGLLMGVNSSSLSPRPYTPGPHNKNPRHKTFAKGWVAQNNIFDRYLDGCAKTFQDVQRVGSENTGIF